MIPFFHKNNEIQTQTLADSNELEASGSYIDLQNARSGIGLVIIGDNTAYALFSFTTAGVVTLISNSANVFTTLQTGTNHFLIKQNSTNVRIVNELGSSYACSVNIIYN